MGYENGEMPYVMALEKIWGMNKCFSSVTKSDFKKHDPGTRDVLEKRCKGDWLKIGLTFGMDMEDKQGQILGPTVSRIIALQWKRTICGDRHWFEHEPSFKKGKLRHRSWPVKFEKQQSRNF